MAPGKAERAVRKRVHDQLSFKLVDGSVIQGVRPLTSASLRPKYRASSLQLWLALPVLLGLLGLLALVYGYWNSLVPVTLVVNGQARQIRTHQTTVESVLREAGVRLYPQDIVTPDVDGPISPGGTITVDHAHLVSVEADGKTMRVRTHQMTPEGILEEMGVRIGSHDIVECQMDDQVRLTDLGAGGSDSPTEAQVPSHIRIERAVPVTVQEGNEQPQHFYTTAATVGEALHDAGVVVYLADTVRPSLSDPLEAGIYINIERSTPVEVQVDGRTLRTRSHRQTVGQVLSDLDVTLQGLDYAVPELDTPLGGAPSIQVVRVREEILVEQEPIPFETQWAPDPELELDVQQLGQEGQTGVYERRIRVRYENGQEVERKVEAEWIVRQPSPRIYNYGTKVVLRTINTPSGPVQYWRHIRMYATSYSAATAGKAPTHPTYGITALGWQMRFGIVAVDPRVVRLGSRVYVPGYGVGDAADTGGAIKGRRIDLGYDDDNLRHWASCVDVYLLAPVPDNIDYTLDFPLHPWCR